MIDQGPGDGDSLPLSSGKLGWFSFFLSGELYHLQHLRHTLLDLFSGDTPKTQAIADVLSHSHVREQGVALEDRVDIPLLRLPFRHILTLQEHMPRIGKLQPGDDAERRGLSASGRT